MELVITLIYACLLAIIFVIDLKSQLVLNKVTYPAMLLAFALSPFWPGIENVSWLPEGVIGKLLSSLIGGIIGLVIMALPFVLYRGVGLGDVKLGGLIGLMVGFPLIIIAMMLAWIIGSLVGAGLLALKIKQLKDSIPFATVMTLSAMATLLWGSLIFKWYKASVAG